MKIWLLPFAAALQFLTRLPIHLKKMPGKEIIARSVYFYPVVGLLLGGMLALLNMALHGAPTLLSAAIVLAFWVFITGAIHLDGLADSADAWIGGARSRARTLAIMKDPYCGPMAVVTVVVVLATKICAIASLNPSGGSVVLLLTPLLARSSIPLLFATTPYARSRGLGSAMTGHFHRLNALLPVSVAWLLAWHIDANLTAWMLLALIGSFLWLRRMMIQRLGGTTGDSAGALIELSETSMLLIAALTTAGTIHG